MVLSIKGRVVEADGTPAAGCRVRVYDAALDGPGELLGEADTDSEGRYEVRYSQNGLQRSGRRWANVLVRAASPAGTSVESPITHKVTSALIVDLTLPAEALTEVERTRRAVLPLVGRELGALGDDQVQRLAALAGIEPAQAAAWVAAERRFKDSAIPLEVCYALERTGALSELHRSEADSREVLKTALKRAVAERLIPAPKQTPEALAEQVIEEVAKLWLREPSSAPSIIQLWSSILLQNAKARARLCERYLTTSARAGELVETLDSGLVTDPEREALAFSIFLLDFARGDLAAAQALQLRVRSKSNLARFDLADFALALEEDLVPAPTTRAGEGAGEARQRQALALWHQVHDMLGTEAFLLRLRDGVGTLGANPALRELVHQNRIEDLLTLDIPAFVAGAVLGANADRAQLQAQLEAVQRTYRLTRDYASVDYLLRHGFDTPAAILSVPRLRFIEAHRAELTTLGASVIYDRAGEAAALVAATVAQYSPGLQRPRTTATTPVPEVGAGVLPNARELFGDLDSCACDPCASIFSVPAYLVDLLQYLDRATLGAGLQRLRVRRGDVTALELSCANTEGLLPALDLVNELLEELISREAGRPTASVSATLGTLEERLAHPQRILWSVYDTELFGARFPFNLPLDLRTDELRAYLGALDSSRLEWMELAGGSLDNALRTAEVAYEHLGLNPVDAAILEEAGWTPQQWGLNIPVALRQLVGRMDRMVARTGLSFEVLRRVLACRFVGGTEQGVALLGEGCRLDGLQADLDDGSLIRLHRFLRLQRVLGWEAQSLDRVLVALGAMGSARFDLQPITDDLLLRLSHTKRIAEMLRQDPVKVANWWSSRIDTHLYGAEGGRAISPQSVRALAFSRAQGGYAETPTIPLESSFSLLFDGTIAQLEADDAVLSRQAQANDVVDWSLALRPDGAIVLSIGSSATFVETQPAAVPTGARVRIACTYDGTSVPPQAMIYLNGALLAAHLGGGPLPAELPGGAAAHRLSDPQSGFTGTLRSLTVLDRALTSAEIGRLQAGERSPGLGEPGLGLLIDLNAGFATQAGLWPDLSGHGRDAELIAFPAGSIQDAVIGQRNYPSLEQLLGAGELAPYYQVFLDRSSTSWPAAAFPLDPAGFTAVRRAMAAEAPHLAAALGLSESLLSEAVRGAFGAGPEQVALTEENLAALFRQESLRRGLRLSPEDFRAVLRLSATNPFASPLAAVELIALAKRIEASPFTSTELLELFVSSVTDLDLEARRSVERRRTALEIHALVTSSSPGAEQDRSLREHLAHVLRAPVDLTELLLAELWAPAQEANGTPLIEAYRELAALPAAPRPSDQELSNAVLALTRLERVSRLLTGFGFDRSQAAWLFTLGVARELRGLPLMPLPSGGGSFALFETLLDIQALARLFDRRAQSFTALLPPHGPNTEAELWDVVAATLAWPRDQLEAIRAQIPRAGARRRGQPNDVLSFPADFSDGSGLLAVARVVQRAQSLGVGPDIALTWGALGRPSPAATESVKLAARAASTPEQWWPKAQMLRDRLRERQRDALVSYLLAQPPQRIRQEGRPWSTAEHVADELLLDPMVTAVVRTSRLVQAVASVQRLVQRILANLEPGLTIDGAAADEWPWRRSYRTWEANRRVFVYPENWLFPELRTEKSALFRNLEADLRQGDIDQRSAERALSSYLSGLQEAANLEVETFYWEWSEDPSVLLPPDGELHVVARSRAVPHRYYYRRRRGQRFTPWEPIDLDIQSAAVSIGVKNGRVFLFWLIIQEQAQPNAAAQAAPPSEVRLQLAYAEYRDGLWSGAAPPRRRSPPGLRRPTPPAI